MSSIPGGKGVSQLLVSVQSISLDIPNSGIVSATKTGDTTSTFDAVIDSTFPYFYLPQAVCDKFASVLGLNYDQKTDLYLINSTQRIVNADTKIQIIVADTTNGLKTSKEIVLPYMAFDLNASWPIFDEPVAYFPIRRLPTNDSTAILGRTFLQEAYVIADFERNNFTIASAVPTDSGLQNIVVIHSPLEQPHQMRKLTKGAIAGIVIGSILGILLVAIIIKLIFLRRKPRPGSLSMDEKTYGEIDPHFPSGVTEIDGRPQQHSRHISELSGSTPGVRSPDGASAILCEVGEDAEVPIRHELEAKTDTEAWTRNESIMQGM